MQKSASHIHNRDLLADASVRASLHGAYEQIFFALDNSELRQVLAPVDERANKAKASSRKWGMIAVWLGAFSLFAASAQAWLHDLHVGDLIERGVALSSAITGILSVVIGLFGVMYAGSKLKWMRNRYITERLRQFHFQSMVGLLPEMISDPIKFEASRRAHFEQFKTSHVAGAKDKLLALLESGSDGDGALFADRSAVEVAPDNPSYRQFVDAYLQLRVNAQIEFCELKLARRGLFSSAPRDQLALFSGLGGLAVFGALTLHAAGAAGAVLRENALLNSPFLHVLGLWCFVGAMTLRTLEEGFRPQREVERYRQYRSALISVRDRLTAAQTPAEAVAAMNQLERASYEEMVNFLKAYSEAKFVL